MRLTFPRMGNSHIPFKALFETAGVDVVTPPPSTRRTINLGARYAPEFACFPLKVNIGNFIEAAEMGADTVVMAGGIGPCRFGYYAQVQRAIMGDLGYNLDLVVLEPPCLGWGGLVRQVKRVTGGCSVGTLLRAIRIAWVKCCAVDEVERLAREARPFERERGAVTGALNEALRMIDSAKTPAGVKSAVEKGGDIIMRCSRPGTPGVRVGIVGEIFMILDAFSNLEVERRLGEMGVYVHRFLSMSDWVRSNLLPKSFAPPGERELVESARPWLNHFVGGHGVESVGGTTTYARMGFDGVIQVMPFTCMPEIVAESVLRDVARDMDIPVLTVSLDEHTGEAGLQTRLEAFVDLLSRKRASRGRGVAMR
ncbi:MAG: CoA protein activase [Ignavibacteriales bacterium]